MKKIIGITGLAGSGKDTIGDIICEVDKSFIKDSFANILKDMLSHLFGWDRKLLQGDTPTSRAWREQPDKFWSNALGRTFTPRIALQEMGSNVMREHFCDNIWILALQKKIQDTDKNVVITDVRFPNEINMIKSVGGEIWRVERGQLPIWWKEAEQYNLNPVGDYPDCLKKVHPSEHNWIGVDKPSCIFVNNGSIDDLKNDIIKKLG